MSNANIKEKALDLLSWDLTDRQLCDIEMILNGAFAPLTGFLNEEDYLNVVAEMRLLSGSLWPIPVTLDVSKGFASKLSVGDEIVLRDKEGAIIAIQQIESLWTPDKEKEATQVFGTVDTAHPGVDYLLNKAGNVYIGGSLIKGELPQHHDFRRHRHTPEELRAYFKKMGWHRVIGFHTRHPIFRAQRALMLQSARELEANLLVHPVVGMNDQGDAGYYAKIHSYEIIIKGFPEQTSKLSLLNLAPRFAGPREALWHALIRKNYGCTHFIIGSHHGESSQTFYEKYEAQKLASQFEDELDIQMINQEEMVYVEERAEHLPISVVSKNSTVLLLTDSEFKRRMYEGLEIPEWFADPEVVTEIQKAFPPRIQQGLTIFFTGLSGSGKSTVANALRIKLMEMGTRPVSLLDGDVVRKHLSSELTFSKDHRNLNIQRIGFVASEITKNGGIAICAPIAPYQSIRKEVREMIESEGGFVEVYVSTPIEECERRDRKGMYAKARAGIIKDFTGVDDPYEKPQSPEIEIDTTGISPDACAHRILLKLESLGYI